MPQSRALDTSHVSVITLGDDQTQVKDSSQCIDELKIVESNDDTYLSNVKHKQSNGQMKQQLVERQEDVNIIVNSDKKRNKGSGLSQQTDKKSQPMVVNKLDRIDVESIATTTSHESNREPDEEPMQLRRKPEPAAVMSPNTKKEIELANLRKKTRKRTRKFEIDGVHCYN